MKSKILLIVGLAGIILCQAVICAESPTPQALPPSPSIEGVTVKYCEDITEQLKHYEDSEILFADLTLKAQNKAVRELLKTELAQFTPQVMDEETFVQALLHIVEYSEPQRISDGLLTPCVVLQQVTVNPIHRQRFAPQEIGRVCSFDAPLLTKQIEKMKEEFVVGFFSKKADESIPSSLRDVVVGQDKINKKYGKDLEKLLREKNLPIDNSSVENMQCMALQVYPIEIYALSVPYREELNNVPENTSFNEEQRLRFLASRQARLHGIDPDIFNALIEQESAWKTSAVSYKGAIGLAQLMPMTARHECGLSKAELRNPQANLGCAAHYLAKNLRRFKEIELALCAYNAGPGTVQRNRCRVIRETRNYIAKVMRNADEQRSGNIPKLTLD